jgi:1-acyl-sn-glycerol-3-phosphate acyltransferase
MPLQAAHGGTGIGGVEDIGKQIRPQAERLAAERGWTAETGGLDPALDEIAAHFARAALLSLGWSGQEPAAPAVSLHDRLRILPRHHRLLARLLEVVQDSGPGNAGDAASARAAAERLCARVVSAAPETGPQIELLRQCGQRLAAILRGEADAREVLFGPTAAAAWARFFAELPWYEFYNRLLADAVAAAVDRVPAAAPLRVLEIGAGTGGTTISVLPRLDGRNVQYYFTDVSPFFLAQARERFREREFVHVVPLDIEADPVAQVGAEPFDVVIAANVLHATRSLATTLDHVRKLLAPGGLLVLLESTQKKAWTDLIFGITDGWWRFADLDVRPDHPLLSVSRWQAVLARAGFEAAAAVSERSDDGNPLQAVLLATRPARDGVAPAAKDWLVFADSLGVGERIAAALRERGHRYVLARAGLGFARRSEDAYEVEPADVDQIAHLLDELAGAGFGVDGVIQTWSADAPPNRSLTGPAAIGASRTICGSVLALVQAFARHARSLPPLWLVTTGAQAVADGSTGPDVAQAPLWGIGRVLTSEQPHTRCRLIDLSAQPRAEEIEGLLAEIESDDPDEEIAFRETRRYVTRLRRIALAEAAAARSEEMSPDHRSFRLEVGTPGALESVSLREIPDRPLGPGELLIRVRAAGVNFRDVMLSLGMLPPMPDPLSEGRTILGFECAGIVVACGEQVREFTPGDEVMAVALGAFGSRVVTRAEMVARKPGHLTFEQAATVPLAFVTALYALNRLGRLSQGERVLIHAATGGVGLAAIQLARRAGAVIFATAGNPEKRRYLTTLGIGHVMDSRSLAFADDVMAATAGEGVDVVLNSLAGEAIAKGLSILRPYGRFLELGKRDIHADSAIGLLPFDRNLAFCSVALERMCVDRPADVGSMLREIADLIERRELQPIPHTAFDMAQARSALRHLAQARHIGKLVLTLGEASYAGVPAVRGLACRPEGTYIISGGLGGFGLLVAQWLVDRGATHLVLVSRTGAPTPANAQAFERLRAASASVVVMTGDISQRTDVARIVDEIHRTLPAVRGVMHAAMVLDDAPLARMSVERLQTVIAPKVGGAWNLHEATLADALDFFVMFSSVTSVFGSKGQGNYAAANLFLDTLASYRRSLGRPALTINWGALSGVGHVSQHGEIAQHLSRQGLDSFTPAEALRALEEALTAEVPQLMVARVDWRRWSSLDASATAIKKTRRLAHLAVETPTAQEAASDAGARRSGLAKAPAAERSSLLQHGITELVARVLGTSIKKVDADLPLTDMGIDSLMAVELQTLIGRDFGAAPPLASLLEGATVRQLSATMLTLLVFDDPVSSTAASSTAPEAASSSEVGPVREGSAPGEPPRPQPATPPETPSDHPETSLEADVHVDAPLEHRRATSSPDHARPFSTSAERRDHAIDYSAIDYTRWSPVQRLCRRIIAALFRVFAPVEVIGRENIPASGPAIIAVNHLSMLDVALLLSILPRRGVCIATDRLRKYPWLRWFLSVGDTIYVRRGQADRDALERGLAVLRAGGLLGIAPEGTRSRTGGLMSGHQGVAYLAIEAPARIVPVAAYGQEFVVRNLMRLRRTRVHVRIGSSIAIPLGDTTAVTLRHGTERVMIALAEMLPAAYRGLYADKVVGSVNT